MSAIQDTNARQKRNRILLIVAAVVLCSILGLLTMKGAGGRAAIGDVVGLVGLLVMVLGGLQIFRRKRLGSGLLMTAGGFAVAALGGALLPTTPSQTVSVESPLASGSSSSSSAGIAAVESSSSSPTCMDYSTISSQLYTYKVLASSGRFVINDSEDVRSARTATEQELGRPVGECVMYTEVQGRLYAATMNWLTTSTSPTGPQSIDSRELYNDAVNIVGSVTQDICSQEQDICARAEKR